MYQVMNVAFRITVILFEMSSYDEKDEVINEQCLKMKHIVFKIRWSYFGRKWPPLSEHEEDHNE